MLEGGEDGVGMLIPERGWSRMGVGLLGQKIGALAGGRGGAEAGEGWGPS